MDTAQTSLRRLLKGLSMHNRRTTTIDGSGTWHCVRIAGAISERLLPDNVDTLQTINPAFGKSPFRISKHHERRALFRADPLVSVPQVRVKIDGISRMQNVLFRPNQQLERSG